MPTGERGSATRPIRRYLLSDLYKPHTFEKVRKLVSTEVAALKPEKCYDVWWGAHGCTAAKSRNLGRTAAATGYTTAERPKEEWIAVPVPASCIPWGWTRRGRG